MVFAEFDWTPELEAAHRTSAQVAFMRRDPGIEIVTDIVTYTPDIHYVEYFHIVGHPN